MADELLRVLSGDLEAVEADGPQLSDAQLRRLLEAMVTARALDARCARLHADGEIGFYVAARGEEAAAVGAAAALRSEDWVFPSHRDPGVFLLRGGSLRAWLDQLFGNDSDLTRGRQLPGHHSLPDGRFVSVSSPIGTQIVQATGCAMAIKIRGDRNAVLASFGRAAASTSDFHTALNLAASFTAPVVFLCRNVDLPAAAGSPAPPDSVPGHAVAYGLEGVRVDGTDVLAVLQAVAAARDSAVQGAGATLIEAAGIGPEAEPIVRFRAYLEARGAWDAARQEELDAQLGERLEEAVAAAAAAPGPVRDSLLVDVYRELPWMLQEQRERLLADEGRDDV